MSIIANHLVRPAFVLWAKTCIAHGWLYARIQERTGKFFRNKTYTRTLFNKVKINCDLNDHVQQQIYFFGAYEPIESSLFFDLLSPGNVVVDAGANIGFYTLMMAERVGSNGQVHSFEPVPQTFAKLQANLQLNPQLKNIFLNHKALWNKEEELTFTLSAQQDDNCGAYSASAKSDSIREQKCTATTLVNYFSSSKLQRLDAIKMDIEGAELAALQGALPLIEKHKPIVFLEVFRKACKDFGYSPDALWELFKPLGYKIYLIGDVCERSRWINDFSLLEQSNVLLMPPGAENRIPISWSDKEIRKKYLCYN